MQPCNRRRPSSRLQDNKVRQMFWGIEVCLGSPDLGGGGGRSPDLGEGDLDFRYLECISKRWCVG